MINQMANNDNTLNFRFRVGRWWVTFVVPPVVGKKIRIVAEWRPLGFPGWENLQRDELQKYHHEKQAIVDQIARDLGRGTMRYDISHRR